MRRTGPLTLALILCLSGCASTPDKRPVLSPDEITLIIAELMEARALARELESEREVAPEDAPPGSSQPVPPAPSHIHVLRDSQLGEGPAVLFPCDDCTANKVITFNLQGIRTKYFTSPEQIYSAPVVIDVLRNDVKDVLWTIPDGWKKGEHGFFAIPLDKDLKWTGVQEVHAGHQRTTRLDRNARYVVVVWTGFEGRGKKVYGRSEPTEVE